jgi:hypothetical protein
MFLSEVVLNIDQSVIPLSVYLPVDAFLVQMAALVFTMVANCSLFFMKFYLILRFI